MKKLLSLGFLLGALVALGYFAGSAALERASRSALPKLSTVLASHDIVATEIDFDDAGVASFNSIAWNNVSATIRLPEDSAAAGQAVRVRVAEVELSLVDFSLRRFRLDMRGLSSSTDTTLSEGFDWASPRFKEAAQHGQLVASHIRAGLELELRKPGPGIRKAVEELSRGIREGRMELPIEIDAGVSTSLEGEQLWARLRVVKQDGFSTIQVDAEDLRRQASQFSRPLTEGEITLVAANPLRAPSILFIKKYAEKEAQQAHAGDLTMPEDAYRHVLWSFLLTKRFGADFAEQVTDAHEVGSTTNTEADHRMDYNNNAVGRRYAAAGVNESEILSRVRTDRGVIREAG